MDGMKAVVDEAGRIVVPPELRKQVSLEPGATLEIRLRNGTIELEPEPVPHRLVKKGRFTVLVPTRPVPPLPPDIVETLLDEMKREREGLD
jgi:AbrB family looped-hinge helix DNA binding protein